MVWQETNYSKGIGNGMSIIFTGIVAQLPVALSTTFELGRTGALSTLLLSFFSMSVAVMHLWFTWSVLKKITIQYPKRQPGAGNRVADSSHLPLKLILPSNTSIFAVHFCYYLLHL